MDGEQEAQAGLVSDPLGELIDLNDIDAVAEALDRAKTQAARIYDFQRLVREKLWGQTTGEANTRRLRGERYEIELTAADENWDRAALKKAWSDYPDHRDELLRISEVSVNKAAYKKALSTKGTEAYEAIKSVIQAANLGRPPAPTAKVKALGKAEEIVF